MKTERKEDFPKFTYFAKPLEAGSFVRKKVVCNACERSRDYQYEGDFFTTHDDVALCPWCVADGTAAKKFNGTFQDEAAIESVGNKAATDELLHRTPSYIAWQTASWLSHCEDYMCYLGEATWEQIEPRLQELQDNGFEMDSDVEEQREAIESGDLVLHLFECRTCQRHRVHADVS